MRLYFLTIIMVILLAGCASKQAIVKSDTVPIQPLPPRVAIHKGEDKSKFPNTHWIEKDKGPIKIKPDEKGEGLYWRAPKEGAIAWPYDSWEAFLKSYQNYLDWADNISAIVNSHNEAVEGKTKETGKKPWYQKW